MDASGVFLQKMRSYWGPESGVNSIPSISSELTELSKEINKAKDRAAELASRLLQKGVSTENFLKEQTLYLKDWCQKTQTITKKYEDIVEFKLDLGLALEGKKVTISPQDRTTIELFNKRVNRLGEEINCVKKFSLFPFFQMLENVKAGWDPLGSLRWALNQLWAWQVPDPAKDLTPFFTN